MNPSIVSRPSALARCRFVLFLLVLEMSGFVGLTGMAFAQSPGTVDNAFRPELTDFGHLSGVFVQPDGRLLLGGSSPLNPATLAASARLVRLQANGRADGSFKADVGGFRIAAALAVQPDGRILVGGTYLEVGLSRGRLVRLNADGSLDRGFSTVTFDFSGPSAALPQPDGRIVISGVFTQISGVARVGLARLNADGSLDAGFDARLSNYSSAIALQPDGRLLVAGSFQNVGGVAIASVVRLNADGTLDASFAPVDVFTDGVGHGLDVTGIALQPDGRVVLGGHFDRVNGGRGHVNLVRVNADGTVDDTFNVTVDRAEPVTVNTAATRVTPAFVQDDGRIVLTGAFGRVNGLPAANVARLNADGSFDRGFEADASPFADGRSFLNGKAATPGGRQLVLVGGSMVNPVTETPLAVRLFAGPTDPLPLPVISGPVEVGSQVGSPNFSLRIVASDSPRTYTATGLPAGLSLDNAAGVIRGVPLASGTYGVSLGATNATGTGTAVVTLTILPGNTGTPTVSVSQDVAAISRGTGEVATVIFTRTGGDLASAVNVAYAVSGPLVGGTDYVTLAGVKKIKAGRASASVQVRPLAGGANGKLKLTVVSGPGYIVGSGAKARIKFTD